MIAALLLASALPALGSAEQVWSRCSYQRLLARLRFEDEHQLWSEPAALASWAFVECGVEFDRFFQEAPQSTVRKALRRERRSLEDAVKIDQNGRKLRDI